MGLMDEVTKQRREEEHVRRLQEVERADTHARLRNAHRVATDAVQELKTAHENGLAETDPGEYAHLASLAAGAIAVARELPRTEADGHEDAVRVLQSLLAGVVGVN